MKMLVLAVVFALSVPMQCRSATQDESLAQALKDSGWKSLLRPELQRAKDERLALIESKGVEKCGLFKGSVHVVHNASEVSALSGKLKPGDQLVLVGAEWKDMHFNFAGHGTQAAPILIRPEVPGGAVFAGLSYVAFEGEHLIISGLTFRGTQVPKSGSVLFRLGNGAARGADRCIVDHLTIEGCNSPRPDDWPKIRMFDVTVQGADNTVAHSTFADMKHYGQVIAAQDLPNGRLQHLHILDNRFLGRPKIDNQNGYEIIQIGWSGEKAGSSGSLIEGNVFENCSGEDEIITLKASDVVVRDNTFKGCQGALSLRECNRVLVQDNVFDGGGTLNTGGVRFCGDGHLIVGNTFRNLRKPNNYYYWPMSMMAASAEACSDDMEGYGRAKNVLIARNRFEQNDHRIAVGIYPRPQYPLLPRNIKVADNVFKGCPGTGAADYLAPDATGELAHNFVESGNRSEP